MHPPFLLGDGGGEGVELPTKFSKRGGLDPLRNGDLRKVAGKEGGDFFSGGLLLLDKK